MRSIDGEFKHVHDGIERLRKKLNQRFLAEPKKGSTVYIRDIIVVSHNPTHKGEFEFDPHSLLPSGKKRSEETHSELVDRLFSQIVDIGNVAAEHHRAENCDPVERKAGRDSLLDDKLNHLTRVITNEFLFYPCKARGPIPEKYFLTLIERIEKFANTLPPNLQLALGTFPVVNEFNEVHNQMLYVQCGPKPKIDVFAKASPFRNDPAYPYTTTPYYSSSNRDNYYSEDLSFFSIQFIALYLEIENMKSDPTKASGLAAAYLELDATFKRIVEIARRPPIYLIGASRTNAFLSLFEDVYKKLKENVPMNKATTLKILMEENDSYAKYVKSALREHQIFNLDDSEQKSGLSDRMYGMRISCETVGGIGVQLMGDICVDYHDEVSASLLQQMHRANFGQQVFPSLGSQFVSSGTTSITSSELFLTREGTITQADPLHPRVLGEKKSSVEMRFDLEEKTDLDIEAKFTDSFNRFYIAPVKLSRFHADVTTRIESSNQLAIYYKACELYKTTHPEESNLIDRNIDHYVLSIIKSRILPFIGGENKLLSEKCVELTNQINELLLNPNTNRNAIILFISNIMLLAPGLYTMLAPYRNFLYGIKPLIPENKIDKLINKNVLSDILKILVPFDPNESKINAKKRNELYIEINSMINNPTIQRMDIIVFLTEKMHDPFFYKILSPYCRILVDIENQHSEAARERRRNVFLLYVISEKLPTFPWDMGGEAIKALGTDFTSLISTMRGNPDPKNIEIIALLQVQMDKINKLHSQNKTLFEYLLKMPDNEERKALILRVENRMLVLLQVYEFFANIYSSLLEFPTPISELSESKTERKYTCVTAISTAPSFTLFSKDNIDKVLQDLFQNKKISPAEFHKAKHNDPLMKLLNSKIITLMEFKNILMEDSFLNLIKKGIIGESEITLMRKRAPYLLKEPTSFTHVFDAIKQLGNREFEALSDTKKCVLFSLPYEIYVSKIKKKASSETKSIRDDGEHISVSDYLAMSAGERIEFHKPQSPSPKLK